MSKVEVTYYVISGGRVGLCVHRALYPENGTWFASRDGVRTAYSDTLQGAVDAVWSNGEILLKGEDGQVLGARVEGTWFGRFARDGDPLCDVYPLLDGSCGDWRVCPHYGTRDLGSAFGDPLEACRAYLAAEASAEPEPNMRTITIVGDITGQGAQVVGPYNYGWECANARTDHRAARIQDAIDAAYPTGDLRVMGANAVWGANAVVRAVRVDGKWVGGAWWDARNTPPTTDEPNAFTKHDQAKPRTDLLPPRALLAMAAVLAHGAEKYGDDNWKRGGVGARPRYIAAALRHVLAYQSGEELDPESGLGHLAHALTSLAFAFELGEV